MTIIAHSFNEIGIAQLSEEATIGGKNIPKGYVNATQMCKVGKKQFKHWNETKRSSNFLEALSRSVGIPTDLLIVSNSEGLNDERGTWVHPKVATSIASWISPEFEVWASDVLLRVINGEFQTLTEEAKEAQQKLKLLWEEIRVKGKVSRRTLADAIKNWYERNPNCSTCPMGIMIAKTTNAIYQSLWSMDALEIESKLGCDRNQSRNFMSAECLKVLERAEDRVTEFIDLDNLKPIVAVVEARLRASRVEL